MKITHVTEHLQIDTPPSLIPLGIPKVMRMFGNMNSGFQLTLDSTRENFISQFPLLMGLIRAHGLDDLESFEITLSVEGPYHILKVNYGEVELSVWRTFFCHEAGKLIDAGTSLINYQCISDLDDTQVRELLDDPRVNTSTAIYTIDICYIGDYNGEDFDSIIDEHVELAPATAAIAATLDLLVEGVVETEPIAEAEPAVSATPIVDPVSPVLLPIDLPKASRHVNPANDDRLIVHNFGGVKVNLPRRLSNVLNATQIKINLNTDGNGLWRCHMVNYSFGDDFDDIMHYLRCLDTNRDKCLSVNLSLSTHPDDPNDEGHQNIAIVEIRGGYLSMEFYDIEDVDLANADAESIISTSMSSVGIRAMIGEDRCATRVTKDFVLLEVGLSKLTNDDIRELFAQECFSDVDGKQFRSVVLDFDYKTRRTYA